MWSPCQKKEESKSCCTEIFLVLYGFVLIGLFIFFICLAYFYYYAFAAIALLAFYLFVNEYLTLFAKKPVDIVFSIISNFSDFGIIFNLSLICFYVVQCFFDFIVIIFKKGICLRNKMLKMEHPEKEYSLHVLIGFPLVIGALTLFFIYVKRISILIIAVPLEIFFLIIGFLLGLFIQLFNSVCKCNISIDVEPELSESEASSISYFHLEEEEIIEEEEEECDHKKYSLLEFWKNLVFVSSFNGMFDTSYNNRVVCQNQMLYRTIITIILFIMQLYTPLYSYFTGLISLKKMLILIAIKIACLYKAAAYNLVDLIINSKRVMYSLKRKTAKVAYFIVLILFIAGLILYFAALIIIHKFEFPQIKSANFEDNNQTWYKFGDMKKYLPEGFCMAQAKRDGSLKIEDLAMLATLPRLYGVNKNGKCYIKPSFRGLFNSTMKYIFGKNYEEDNIRIYCKKMTRHPILVITSDKILNHTLDFFKYDDDIIMLENKQNEIINNDYFENQTFGNLPENGKNLLNIYEKCVEINGTQNCESQWDSFTQYYWPSRHSDKYEDIKGFERYQINIDSDMVFQPSFITGEGELMAGTHYIVGGSFEDSWGVGILIETYGRAKIVPTVVDNLLILYSIMRGINRDAFLGIEWMNRQVFHYNLNSLEEMNEISNLYSQFNFSQESLYTVGHSISGTAFKGASYFHDVPGIAFESLDGDSNINLKMKFSFLKKPISDSYNQITNIYSDGAWISSEDENCDVNGILPPRYYLPNVYDTACLTAITCANTMKYVPFCKQVLSMEGNPEEEFNVSLDAFLDYYWRN